jgi:hypothetical protein
VHHPRPHKSRTLSTPVKEIVLFILGSSQVLLYNVEPSTLPRDPHVYQIKSICLVSDLRHPKHA